jgi:hypothetical protein
VPRLIDKVEFSLMQPIFGSVFRWECQTVSLMKVHFILRKIFCLSKNIQFKIYGTVILSALYGCESWSLKLREKCRLKVFQNMVLGNIFWPNRLEVTAE